MLFSQTVKLIKHQNHEKVKQSHFLAVGLTPSCFLCEGALLELRPVFLSSPALLNITVNPSAVAGSFTSHSPNFGKGLASLFDAISIFKIKKTEQDFSETNSFLLFFFFFFNNFVQKIFLI